MTNTIDRIEFEQAIEQVGYEDIRENYSGRFMYGKVCVAVVTDSPDSIKRAVIQAANSLREDAEASRDDNFDASDEDKYADGLDELADKLDLMVESTSVDNMGLSYVVYFPGWEFSA